MLSTHLIGLGRIAWLLEKDPLRYHPCTHGGTLRSMPSKFRLTGACDIDPEKTRAFQRWWPEAPRPVSSYDSLLTDSAPPDLTVIAVSLEAHFEIACKAIKSGSRAILLEKPIGLNLKEAKELRRLALKHKTLIWVNFERRYHPAYIRVRDFIRKETLGPLRAIRGQVLTGQPHGHKLTAGPLLHDAVHWIDLLIWYAGRPEFVQPRMFRVDSGEPIDATAFLEFNYPEYTAYLESGGKRNFFEFTMQFEFAAGRIISGNAGHHFYKSAPSTRYKNFRELKEFTPKIPTKNPWQELYKEVSRVTEKSKKDGDLEAALEGITANLQDAFTGMELIMKAYSKL